MLKWDPQTYAASWGPQLNWATDLIRLACIRPDDIVLDVGCGDGRITAILAGHATTGSVVGIDSSAEMIRHAIAAYPRSKHPNLEFRLMDARQITLPAGFTCVFSNAVLHWFAEQPLFLAGAWRVLEHGGRLVAACAAKNNAQDLVLAFRRVMRQRFWRQWFRGMPRPFHPFCPEQYAQWLNHAGFKTEMCEVVTETVLFPSPKTLQSWIQAVWLPYTQRVPAQYRNQFVAEVVDHFIRGQSSADTEAIPVDTCRLVIRAIKP